MEYLGEDEPTKAIILYIEGIREGQRFLDVAQKSHRINRLSRSMSAVPPPAPVQE